VVFLTSTAYNKPHFGVKMEVECIEWPDTKSRVASVDIEIKLTERVDCSISSSLNALYVDAQTDKDWEAIKDIGRKIVEVAEKAQEKTKAILEDRYNKTLQDQYQERKMKSEKP
jgi:hypothetical protein